MATLSIVSVGDSNTQGNGVTSAQTCASVMRDLLAAQYPATTYTFTNYGASWSAAFNWRPDSPVWGPGAPNHNGEVLFNSVMALNPDIIPVMLGTNDASSNRTKAQYKADVEAFIIGANAHTFSHAGNPLNHPLVVLVDPPVAAESSDANTSGAALPAGYYPYGRSSAKLRDFRDALAELAAQYGLPHVASYAQFAAVWDGSSNTATTFLIDGVHLNATGHGSGMLAGWAKSTLASSLTSAGEILGALVRAWDGTAWVAVPAQDHDGSAWVSVPMGAY